MGRTSWSAAAFAVGCSVGFADIAHADPFNVPPGRLGDVITALGVQAEVTITVPEPDVAAEHSLGVNGNLSLPDALSQALRGTDAEAVFYDRVTIRIIRHRTAPLPPTEPTAPTATEPTAEVVIAASKQGMSLNNYPGSVEILGLQPGWVADNAAAGTDAIVELLPSVAATNLGSGRDKLFIRGIADSSFNGPTQSTVGEYLDDVRLNYNAPDPDFNLYDMKRVEVLVGPQGTLYGAGSLGGVIRLVPNTPDTHEVSGTVAAGVSPTELGGVGGDGATMINLPLLEDRVAVRTVLFGSRAAGYIDDPARGLQDINGSASYGLRSTLRFEGLWGWTVDFGAVVQNIVSADGQYTLSDDPPLTRDSAIAQPFQNDYRLAYITARRALGGAEIVSTTSTDWNDLISVYDATGYDGTTMPARFEERDVAILFSHETRIAGGSQQAPWVAGLGTLYTTNTISRTLGPVNAATQIAGVINGQAEGALFGQMSRSFTKTVTGTIGERITLASGGGAQINRPNEDPQTSTRVFFSNTLALDWHPEGQLSAFFHYQQGYRAGGVTVESSGVSLAGEKFAPDSLNMDEIGIRWGDEAHDTLWVRAATFFADWNHMQADLVDSQGLPYTANIGHGRIIGLDAEAAWRVAPALTLSAAAFGNGSRLVAPAPRFATAGPQTLPNVADTGERLAAEWRSEVAPGVILSGRSSVRYVGASNLGVGPYLDIPQGNYFVADAGARLDFGRLGVSLNIDNLGDARANTFSFGNPFQLAQREEMTPLRPRTIRLGIDTRY